MAGRKIEGRTAEMSDGSPLQKGRREKEILSHQIFMNRFRRLASGAHGQDDGRGAGDNVASGINPFLAGGSGLGIGDDITPFVGLQV